jgi:hypothetical protein
MTLTPGILILLLKIQKRKDYNYAKGMVIVTEAPCQSDFCNFALHPREKISFCCLIALIVDIPSEELS